MLAVIRFIGTSNFSSSERKMDSANAITATHNEMLSHISSLYHVIYFFVAKYNINAGIPISIIIIRTVTIQYRMFCTVGLSILVHNAATAFPALNVSSVYFIRIFINPLKKLIISLIKVSDLAAVSRVTIAP